MRTRELKKLIGEPVIVYFDDHTLNLNSMECIAIGFLQKITQRRLYLMYWDLKSPNKKVRKENLEYCTILKRVIKKIVVLKHDHVLA